MIFSSSRGRKKCIRLHVHLNTQNSFPMSYNNLHKIKWLSYNRITDVLRANRIKHSNTHCDKEQSFA
jgi:hypothetical protein